MGEPAKPSQPFTCQPLHHSTQFLPKRWCTRLKSQAGEGNANIAMIDLDEAWEKCKIYNVFVPDRYLFKIALFFLVSELVKGLRHTPQSWPMVCKRRGAWPLIQTLAVLSLLSCNRRKPNGKTTGPLIGRFWGADFPKCLTSYVCE